MPSPSEEAITEIRNALGCSYDPEQDEKVIKQLKEMATWGTGFITAGLGAFFAAGYVVKSEAFAPATLILYSTPLIPQAMFFLAACAIHSATPLQRKTVEKIDRAAFEIYDHAKTTGDCSRTTVQRLLGRHALPKHVKEGLAQKCARIEYILRHAIEKPAVA